MCKQPLMACYGRRLVILHKNPSGEKSKIISWYTWMPSLKHLIGIIFALLQSSGLSVEFLFQVLFALIL